MLFVTATSAQNPKLLKLLPTLHDPFPKESQFGLLCTIFGHNNVEATLLSDPVLLNSEEKGEEVPKSCLEAAEEKIVYFIFKQV